MKSGTYAYGENDKAFVQTLWGYGGVSVSLTSPNENWMPFWNMWFRPRHTVGPR